MMEVKGTQKNYYFTDRDNKLKTVAKDREDIAKQIDQDDDKFFLSDQEITTYLEKSLILKKGVTEQAKEKIIADFKLALEDKGKEIKDYYPSYEEIINDFKALESKYPNLAKVVKLNDKPTDEGRDIIALKISSGVQGNTSNKPGAVLTSIHHAREWATVKSTTNTAHYLLENYDNDEQVKRRLDNAEIWIVPLVNPDGYEYSRNEYRYWRKDRQQIEKDWQVTIGVDPNRNYWDGKEENYHWYRPAGDSADSYADDDGASDEPPSELFRGLAPASSGGIKALLDLELGRLSFDRGSTEETPCNIKGVINYHAYGNVILYPMGYSSDPVPKEDYYKELCAGVKGVMGADYEFLKSYEYGFSSSTGSSDTIDADGLVELTIEIGSDFFPPQEEVEKLKKDTNAASNYFIDWIIDKYGKKSSVEQQKTQMGYLIKK